VLNNEVQLTRKLFANPVCFVPNLRRHAIVQGYAEALLLDEDTRTVFCEQAHAHGRDIERGRPTWACNHSVPAMFAPMTARYGYVAGDIAQYVVDLRKRPSADDRKSAIKLPGQFPQKHSSFGVGPNVVGSLGKFEQCAVEIQEYRGILQQLHGGN